MKTTALKITGMNCAACASAVKNALAAVPKVRAAEVSLERGSARVEHDGADEGALLRAVADEGYEVVAVGAQ